MGADVEERGGIGGEGDVLVGVGAGGVVNAKGRGKDGRLGLLDEVGGGISVLKA